MPATYATPEDFIAAYGEEGTARLLNDQAEDLLNHPQLVSALEAANGEAATHVRYRYRVNLSSVPPVLRRKTIDLARWYLVTALRPEIATELDTQVHDAAIEWFRQLREGEVQLPLPETDEVPKPGDPSVVEVGENVRYEDEPALHRHRAFKRF